MNPLNLFYLIIRQLQTKKIPKVKRVSFCEKIETCYTYSDDDYDKDNLKNKTKKSNSNKNLKDEIIKEKLEKYNKKYHEKIIVSSPTSTEISGKSSVSNDTINCSIKKMKRIRVKSINEMD
mmetsp:Transcript_22953/g.20853  ORF Transcript_22953/g.20853 Transcript_22953/m.20853 type:complete len:121 (+) Transcript_22953:119-481(+)